LLLIKNTQLLEEKLNQQDISTISDLQTLMVVKERLDDVKIQLKGFMETESKEEMFRILAYAEERYQSAVSWMHFFAMDGKKLEINKEQLQSSCVKKIAEAEERQQYAGIFVGQVLTSGIKERINQAEKALEQEEYELCLIKAIQGKGEANAILSSMGLSEDSIDDFISSKIKAVERVISDNSEEGMFPILGYSYLQYAKSLKEQEKITSLIYLEYGLEMGDLGIYFPVERPLIDSLVRRFMVEEWIFVLEGFVLGIFVTLLTLYFKKEYFKKKRKKKK